METDLSRTITLKRSILIEDDCECTVIPAGTNISFDMGGIADVDCLPISLYRFDERAIGKQHLPSSIGINKILGIRRLYFHGEDMLCHSLYGDVHIENITFGQYGSMVLARKFHSGYIWDEDAFIGKISAIAIDAIEEEIFVSDLPDKFSIKFGVCPTAKDYDELTANDIGDTIRIDGRWAKLCDFGIGNEMLHKYQAERGRNNKPIDSSFCDNNFNRNVVCAELEGGQLVLCPYGEKATAFFFNKYSRPFAIRVEADMEQIANHESTFVTMEDYAKAHCYKDS